MSYHPDARKERLDSEGYLEYLDQRMGFPIGTLHGLCLAAVKSRTRTKLGVKVTYRGKTECETRIASHHFVERRKAIFLIEFKMTKAGRQMDRVVQVQLEV